MNENAQALLASLPLEELFARCPAARDYLIGLRMETLDQTQPFAAAVCCLPERCFEEFETSRLEVAETLASLLTSGARQAEAHGRTAMDTITVLGGHDKSGGEESLSLTVRRGETVGIVGPTGAGKSCLLEDIECLAQGDTPTGRRILVNGAAPSDELRFDIERRPVAQLSQNMNFIMDLTAAEFLREHAQSRMASDSVLADILACANDLAGEPFSPDTHVTRLSGGQSRALMIADTLLLSDSPILLIDEIENAGIDRRKAIQLFRKTGKMIFLSTHDPLLALSVNRRLVIRNGAVAQVLESTSEERTTVDALACLDRRIQLLRDEIRTGKAVHGRNAAWFLSDDSPESGR